ncbi:hypothetical protein HBN76_04405 [Pseudomonas sp. WS 5013]|nr:hypothetical protein [Pseudomonas sp. WS 5013]
MDVLSLIQQALDASSKLRELARKVEDAEFRMVLAELHSALADAKLESVELKTKLAAAQEVALKLQQQLDLRESAEPDFVDGCYSFPGVEGRFCTACWDARQKKVRVHETPYDFAFAGKWTCPSCNSSWG